MNWLFFRQNSVKSINGLRIHFKSLSPFFKYTNYWQRETILRFNYQSSMKNPFWIKSIERLIDRIYSPFSGLIPHLSNPCSTEGFFNVTIFNIIITKIFICIYFQIQWMFKTNQIFFIEWHNSLGVEYSKLYIYTSA